MRETPPVGDRQPGVRPYLDADSDEPSTNGAAVSRTRHQMPSSPSHSSEVDRRAAQRMRLMLPKEHTIKSIATKVIWFCLGFFTATVLGGTYGQQYLLGKQKSFRHQR